MINGFIKMMRSDDIFALISHSKNAFALLSIIALRARRNSSTYSPVKLQSGEALIGDFEQYGLTEGEYRHAKQILKSGGFATFRATPMGTVATLSDTRVYDINPDDNNGRATDENQTKDEQIKKSGGFATPEATPIGPTSNTSGSIGCETSPDGNNGPNNGRTTDEQRTNNGRTTTNKNVRRVRMEERNGSAIAVPSDFQFPPHLDTPKFHEVLQAWIMFRSRKGRIGGREEKIKFFQNQIDKIFSTNSESIAIAMANQSIELGYTGLFPLKRSIYAQPPLPVNPTPAPEIDSNGLYTKF